MTEPRAFNRPLPIDLPLCTPPALGLLTRPVALMVRGGGSAGGAVPPGVPVPVVPAPTSSSSGGVRPAAAPPAQEGV